ncbi:MAG: transposase [Treponema sp.]|nr:transposase [Treponema sp.]
MPGCLFTDKKEALISMVVEAYTNGVSTRKIKHLAENM